jgi:hypothetical protein
VIKMECAIVNDSFANDATVWKEVKGIVELNLEQSSSGYTS